MNLRSCCLSWALLIVAASSACGTQCDEHEFDYAEVTLLQVKTNSFQEGEAQLRNVISNVTYLPSGVGGVSNLQRLRFACQAISFRNVCPECGILDPRLLPRELASRGITDAEVFAEDLLNNASLRLCPSDPTWSSNRTCGGVQVAVAINPDLFPDALRLLFLRASPLLLLSLLLLCPWSFWPDDAAQPRPSAAEARSLREEALGTASLTGLRAGLSVWIFAERAGLQATPGGSWGAFLVLSGCVLSLSRMGEEPGVARAPFTAGSALRFVFLRYKRIMPLMWFYQAAAPILFQDDWNLGVLQEIQAVLANLFASLVSHPRSFLLAGSLEPADADHPWLPGVMVVLYALYPVLEMVMLGLSGKEGSQRRLLGLGLLAVAVKVATGFALQAQADIMFLNWWSMLPEFVLGMLIPHMASTTAPDALVILADLLAFAWLALGLLAASSPQLGPSLAFLSKTNCQMPLTALLVWAACFGPRPSLLGLVLRQPPLVWAGRFGYSFYLWHAAAMAMLGLGPSVGILQGLTPQLFLRLSAGFGFCTALAAASYKLVEEPGMALGNRLVAFVERKDQSSTWKQKSLSAG